ncbi:hypothetical protein VNO77_43997 [Canavalia gladiata]|uniref:Uncharacterized protein n=1 Tax=Canavalia gladiata TaxID=3824 RepID=A0AAN9PQC3_CANGL
MNSPFHASISFQSGFGKTVTVRPKPYVADFDHGLLSTRTSTDKVRPKAMASATVGKISTRFFGCSLRQCLNHHIILMFQNPKEALGIGVTERRTFQSSREIERTERSSQSLLETIKNWRETPRESSGLQRKK